jgi:TonB family protein
VVHAIIVALLLWTLPQKQLGEPVGPSTEVPVVFETSGAAPALPDPQPMESAPGDPDPAPPLPEMPDAPPTPGPPTPAPPAPTPVPPVPAPPMPAPPMPVPPRTVPAPPAALPETTPPQPEPPQPEPPAPAPQQVPPPPADTPPRPAEPTPEPPPPSNTAELVLPLPPPPPPPQAEQAPRAVPPRPRSPFPGTLDLSRQPPMALAPPPPRGGVPRQSLPPGALDLSMGRVPQQRSVPADPNSSTSATYVEGSRPSGSWMGAFGNWAQRHIYYPPEAGRNGEDGMVTLQIVIERSGQVRSVTLKGRSGSRLLDLGAQSVFRNQFVPPFTPDMEGETTTLEVRMRYTIIYR